MHMLRLVIFFLFAGHLVTAQAPPSTDTRIYDIIESVSADRIEKDIRKLVS